MMHNIFRFVYRNMLPLRARNSLDLFEELRQSSFAPMHAGENDLDEKNILVLSPHPDDDVIGCGGTLHIYHRRGAKITIVYMTDGRKGNPGFDENDLIISRKEEAKKAAAIIGFDNLIHLENRDTELSVSPTTVNELSGILNKVRPDAVFLPFLLDNHPDHIATTHIFSQSLSRYKDDLMCYSYEIWTPIIIPNLIVDISEHIQIKNKAIEMHHTQIELSQIVDASMGLAKYRGVLHNLKDGYAEVFFKCNSVEYRRLFQSLK